MSANSWKNAGARVQGAITKAGVGLNGASPNVAKAMNSVASKDTGNKPEDVAPTNNSEDIAPGAPGLLAGAYNRTKEIVMNNPKAAGALVGAAAGPVVMGSALTAVGFSSIGPVAGSIAAGLQSAGWVGAAFSTVQSAAMGGYGVGVVTTAFVAGGSAAGGAAGIVASSAIKKQKRKENDDGTEVAEEEEAEQATEGTEKSEGTKKPTEDSAL